MAHTPVDSPGAVGKLLKELREAGAHAQATALTERLPAAGLFDEFLKIGKRRETFRFGREPDGSPAPPWTWDDLE